jgi:hypothetical protein
MANLKVGPVFGKISAPTRAMPTCCSGSAATASVHMERWPEGIPVGQQAPPRKQVAKVRLRAAQDFTLAGHQS